MWLVVVGLQCRCTPQSVPLGIFGNENDNISLWFPVRERYSRRPGSRSVIPEKPAIMDNIGEGFLQCGPFTNGKLEQVRKFSTLACQKLQACDILRPTATLAKNIYDVRATRPKQMVVQANSLGDGTARRITSKKKTTTFTILNPKSRAFRNLI